MIADPETFSFSFDPDALLHDFLASEGSILELADKHRISIIDLLTWYEDDATQELLQMIETLGARRAALRAMDHVPGAVNALAADLADPGLAPADRARSAGLILRGIPALDATAGRLASTTGKIEPGRGMPGGIGRRGEARDPIAHAARHRSARPDRGEDSQAA